VSLLLINCDGIIECVNGSDAPLEYPSLDEALCSLERAGVRVRLMTRLPAVDREALTGLLGSDCTVSELPGRLEKSEFYSAMKLELSLADDEVAVFGCDADDVPIIEAAGFSAVPLGAAIDVRSSAYYVASGAPVDSLAEVVDIILRAKA